MTLLLFCRTLRTAERVGGGVNDVDNSWCTTGNGKTTQIVDIVGDSYVFSYVMLYRSL